MTLRLSGEEKIKLLLEALQQATEPEGVLDEVGAVLLNRTRTRFLEQVDPDGNPWPQSKAAQRRSGGGTLFDTGSLFRSIQLFKAGEGRRLIAVDPSATNTRTGTQVTKYAVKHQQGLEGNPQRQFLGFAEADEKVAIKVLTKRLKRAVGD